MALNGKLVKFVRLRGKIVPIIRKVANQKLASKIGSPTLRRKALRNLASSKTNIFNKRIEAIRSVRSVKTSIASDISRKNTRKLRDRADYIGSGLENIVFKRGGKAVKFPKSSLMDYFYKPENLRGGKFSILLADKKISPETFVVSTSKADYIVQDIVKGTEYSMNPEKLRKVTRKLENILGGSNVIVDDLHRGNVLKTGRGFNNFKVIDTGTFNFVDGGFDRSNFSAQKLKKINKFVITSKKRRE